MKAQIIIIQHLLDVLGENIFFYFDSFKTFKYLYACILFHRKLTEKLLSSAAAANDVNEARCNALVCEPKLEKFRLCSQDYAFVMMTDKVYEMYLKTGFVFIYLKRKF